MIIMLEIDPPVRWRPYIERNIGALRWRVQWLWFAVSMFSVDGINELVTGIASKTARKDTS